MRLQTLEIGDFKSLHNFRIEFGPGSNTVLLGKNATGKSQLLEALVLIFRDLELGAAPAFRYKIRYECRENIIRIDADPERDKSEQMRVSVESPEGVNTLIAYQYLYADYENGYPPFLPKHIFSYYSGTNSRMANLFTEYREGIYREVLRGTEKLSRSLFHASSEYGPLALLAFFVEEDEKVQKFLRQHFCIQNIVSVLFIVQEPPWSSKEGNPRFWNARGVVERLLGYLYEIALAPMRFNVRVNRGFASKATLEHLYLYLRGADDLKKLYQQYKTEGRHEFFKAFESIYISKMLSEVKVKVQKLGMDRPLTFQDLSEGEQQLLMVLGLLRFTKEEEALFLLDEPDTHLNPAWSVQYLEFMKTVVGDDPSSQVIMTTHNPLVISSLKREAVRIMERKDETGQIQAIKPREDPLGMGVTNILTSELFGLRFALDPPTEKLLDERRGLALKENLSQDERHRLGELTGYLEGLGYALTEDDPLYAAFLKKLQAREDAAIQWQIALTTQQHRDRIDLIDQIIDELTAEGHWTI